jgi:hypothetical protein
MNDHKHFRGEMLYSESNVPKLIEALGSGDSGERSEAEDE